MTTPPSSFDWVPEIAPNLKQLDSIPLTGNVPPFPWNDFSNRLAASFDKQEIKIQPGQMVWRTKEKLYEEMGEPLTPLIISIPSIEGLVSWIIPQQEVPVLAALLFTKEPHPLPLIDEVFYKSFYHFLAIEVLYHFTEVSFDQSLSPILTEHTQLPDQDSLCWDISILIQNHVTKGRLIISPEFRQSWIKYFAKKNESLPASEQMTQLANVTLHLEAGKTQLNLNQWMAVKPGDFLALDSCSLDPERLEGRVLLTLNGISTFRAKFKDETLKILELPLIHEV